MQVAHRMSREENLACAGGLTLRGFISQNLCKPIYLLVLQSLVTSLAHTRTHSNTLKHMRHTLTKSACSLHRLYFYTHALAQSVEDVLLLLLLLSEIDKIFCIPPEMEHSVVVYSEHSRPLTKCSPGQTFIPRTSNDTVLQSTGLKSSLRLSHSLLPKVQTKKCSEMQSCVVTA